MRFLMEEHRAEALCLLLLFAIGVALLVGAAALPEPMFDPLGPAGLPRYIAYLLLALLALRLVTLFRESRENPRQTQVERAEGAKTGNLLGAGERGIPRAELVDAPQIAKLVLASAITLAYLAALTVKGIPFAWLTMVFLAALGAALTDYTPRKLVIVAAIAVIMSFALTYTFTDVLSLVLPE